MSEVKRGTFLLMGSGEMAPTMVEAHKYAMAQAGGAVKAVFIDTPAGFQLNADLLSEKAVEFFHDKLNTPLGVVSFKSSDQSSSAQQQAAATALVQASYIFAGPGSPTYALRHWANTLLVDAMAESLAQGGCLAFASAASLTLGRFTIPVYEIYKVGESLRWVDGLDILGRAGLEVAVVPHWNNTSGGDHDTRHCFMGEPRWAVLEQMLPPTTVVLGLDEHTACVIRLEAQLCEVRGIGQVVARRNGVEQVFQNGDSFSLDLLRPIGADNNGSKPSLPPEPIALKWADIQAQRDTMMAGGDPSPDEAGSYVYALISWLSEARAQSDWESMRQAEDALRAAMVRLVAYLGKAPSGSSAGVIGPYIQLLTELRNSFRDSKQWDQADLIRKRLTTLGIVLEDGPQGTTWRQEA